MYFISLKDVRLISRFFRTRSLLVEGKQRVEDSVHARLPPRKCSKKRKRISIRPLWIERGRSWDNSNKNYLITIIYLIFRKYNMTFLHFLYMQNFKRVFKKQLYKSSFDTCTVAHKMIRILLQGLNSCAFVIYISKFSSL
ncbi:hypothetical protein PUN28_020034 [Cardiocondyla obscurior]|uniref:Uncharacterized protein n=1 Tax=Cardiocondyla obscurior TaxID=286306 RepID=A0AAW2EA26_9HYME